MSDRISLFESSRLPAPFGVIILILSLIFLLSPYFEGADFGILKIPTSTTRAKKWLKIIGPIFFLACVAFFLPIWPAGMFGVEKAKDSNSDIRTQSAAATFGNSNRPPSSDGLKEITNSIGMELVWIPWDHFTMASSEFEVARANDYVKGYGTTQQTDWFSRELPEHEIKKCGGFYIGKSEVTQAQWEAVIGRENNHSHFRGPDLPVDTVSWDDAQDFIRKLNATKDGYTYSLPSEAQWEFACRAKTTTLFAFGDSLSSEQANFDGNFPYGGAQQGPNRGKTSAVGSFPPNSWGLRDMHGNVMEWCEDVWHKNYDGAPIDCSPWIDGADSARRILRGGSWSQKGVSCRCASRFRDGKTVRSNEYGLRLLAVSTQ